MTLPPRANLVAVRHPDPAVRAAFLRAAGAHPELSDAWEPAPDWVAAAAPLPGTPPEPERSRACGLAFADGRDVVLETEDPERVAALADTRPERLDELPGDFTFVRFRPGGATAVRACGAGVPLHAGVAGERIAITTRLDLLVSVVDEDWRLDPLAVAAWTTGFGAVPYDRSTLAGMTRIPRGHAAVLEPRAAAPRLVRYWDPRVAEPRRDPDHAPGLRATLLATLDRELDPDGRNLLTLSGGVDSSSLAALAAGTLGRGISTLTLLTAWPRARERELPHIDRLDERFGFRARRLVTFDVAERLRLPGQSPPALTPVMHPALGALPPIVEELQPLVLFGGEVADHLCGSELTFPDWAAETPLHALLRAPRTAPFGRQGVIEWGRLRLLGAARRPPLPLPPELPDWLHPGVRAAYADFWRERRAAAARDRRPHRFMTLMLELDGYIDMNWDVASRLGLRRAFPFATRELIEQAYGWHVSEQMGGRGRTRTKVILREALRDDVPRENLMRADRGGQQLPGLADPIVWDERIPQDLEGIVRDEWVRRPPRVLDWARASRLAPLVRLGNDLSDLRDGGSRC